MKRLLLPVLIAFSAASGTTVMAQPTLTAASNNLQVGDQFLSYQTRIDVPEFTTAALAGANQTWNFSTLVSLVTQQVAVLSRAAAPNPTSMPAANMVVKVGDEYAYYENNGTSLKEYGAYEATQNYSLENTDPAYKLRFPFTFNNTFSDTYNGSANLGGTVLPRVGTVTVTAEGYGTLITPGGTYQNVLKVKTNEVSNPGTLYSENSVTYDWFLPGVHFPVLRMARRITLLGTVHTGFFLSQALGTKEDLAAKLNLQVYPNPATSVVKVQFQNSGSELVKLTLHNILGQQISEVPYQKSASAAQTVEIQVADYPKGVYLLKLQTGKNAVTKRLVIE
jgi:hypothetical protein